MQHQVTTINRDGTDTERNVSKRYTEGNGTKLVSTLPYIHNEPFLYQLYMYM